MLYWTCRGATSSAGQVGQAAGTRHADQPRDTLRTKADNMDHIEDVPHGDRMINAYAAPLTDGGYGIFRIDVWSRIGGKDRLTTLDVTNPLTFETPRAALDAAVQIARNAIDAGTV
jgi:hypothetical protein